MMRKLAIGIMVLALVGVRRRVRLDLRRFQRCAGRSGRWRARRESCGSVDLDPARRTAVQVTVAPPAPAAPAPERALSANPLWAMPLAQFPATRERPIFSPSRRPPPSAVAPAVAPKVAAVPKPREPERPQLTLVGTIASDEEGFGIFLDQSTKAVLRLKVGEDFQGWKLRSVQGRETALEKDQQVVTLALPQPGIGQVTSEVPPPPPATAKLRSSRPDRPGR